MNRLRTAKKDRKVHLNNIKEVAMQLSVCNCILDGLKSVHFLMLREERHQSVEQIDAALCY